MNRQIETTDTINSLNEKMMKYKNECGCSLGAHFMTVAFIVSIFITNYQKHFIPMKFLSNLPLVIIISVGSAGVGKLTGILYAKYKYHQVSKQLTKYVTNLKMEEPKYAWDMD